MPAPSIKALAKKAGKSEAEAEKEWAKAKEAAKGKKPGETFTLGADRYTVSEDGSVKRMTYEGKPLSERDAKLATESQAKYQEALAAGIEETKAREMAQERYAAAGGKGERRSSENDETHGIPPRIWMVR